MSRWRAEYDDGIWRFYRDGMELGLYEKGDVVIDALNNAESRIAELEAYIDKLIEAGNELKAGLNEYWEECSTREMAIWRHLIAEWKEREE